MKRKSYIRKPLKLKDESTFRPDGGPMFEDAPQTARTGEAVEPASAVQSVVAAPASTAKACPRRADGGPCSYQKYPNGNYMMVDMCMVCGGLGETQEMEKPKGRVWSVYQTAIFADTAEGEGNTVIRARAGTGKTSVLCEAFKHVPAGKTALFVAFNKKIKEELLARQANGELPGGVDINTLHGFGFRACTSAFRSQLYGDKMLDICYRMLPEKEQRDLRSALSKAVAFAKGCLAQTVDEVKVMLDGMLDNGQIDWAWGDEEDRFVSAVLAVMDECRENPQTIDFDDMVWLPVVTKARVRQYDFVFIDELQDLNRSQRKLAVMACKKDGRIIAVGDNKQCVIDGTKIAMGRLSVPAETVAVGNCVSAAGGRGRAGQQEVLQKYRKWVLDAPVVTVETKSGKSLTTTPEHVYFAGYSGGPETLYFVYLMYRKGRGYRVGTTRRTPSQRNGKGTLAMGWQVRCAQERADALWLLGAFKSEQEASYHEQLYSVKYGLPTWVFWTSQSRALSVNYKDTDIKRLFSEVDTEAGAKELMADLKMSFSRPHHTPKAVTLTRRRNFSITMCADPRGSKALHHYGVSGSDNGDVRKLAKIGLKARPAKGKNGWKIESLSSDLSSIYAILDKVRSVLDVNVIEKARMVEGKALPFTEAANVLPGMTVFVSNGSVVTTDTVKRVTRSTYTGFVNDFDVDRDHNYVANGIVVHNSIYAFRGADANSMDALIEELDAKVLPLSVTYRCASSIVDVAKQIVPDYEAAPGAEAGEVLQVNRDFLRKNAKAGDFVISRANAPLLGLCLSFLKDGKPASIAGRDVGASLRQLIEKSKAQTTIELKRYLDEWQSNEIERLSKRERPSEAAIEAVLDKCLCIEALSEGAKSVAEVLAKIETMFSDKDDKARIVCSTVHRVKGLERDRAWLLTETFRAGKSEEEANLWYVAVTRARKSLMLVSKE